MPISKVYQFERIATEKDIDELEHVNNQVYLDWFMDAATRHSKLVGWGLKKMIADGQGWVVRSHNLEYLIPVKLGDKLIQRTWVETADKVTSERRYELIRKSDGKLVCHGKTMWVWINYKTGHPARIPKEIVEAFINFEPEKI